MTRDQSVDDRAIYAAWLSYVGGYTQAEIAKRLGVSPVKVHRLISEAHKDGYVHVFVDRSPSCLVEYEDRLSQIYGLTSCKVVPTVHAQECSEGDVLALGSAAARHLTQRLNQGDVTTLGTSWGRSLAQMARQLPREPHPSLSVVSVMGSLTQKSAINPFDVIHRLADTMDAQGFFLPVPFIADSVDARKVLIQQRCVRDVLERALETEVCYLGIGAISLTQPMFDRALTLLGKRECEALRKAGATGELAGHFLDRDGQLMDTEINQRTIGLRFSDLYDREVVAVAGGVNKVAAIRAVLKSGVLDGLIVDEPAAARLCELEEQAA